MFTKVRKIFFGLLILAVGVYGFTTIQRTGEQSGETSSLRSSASSIGQIDDVTQSLSGRKSILRAVISLSQRDENEDRIIYEITTLASLNNSNFSLPAHTVLTQMNNIFFTNEIILGILIGCSIMIFIVLFVLVAWHCKKLISRRNLTRANGRRTKVDKRNIVSISDENVKEGCKDQTTEAKLLETSSHDKSLQAITVQANNSANDIKQDAASNFHRHFHDDHAKEIISQNKTTRLLSPQLPQVSNISAKNMAGLENMAYGAMISSFANDGVSCDCLLLKNKEYEIANTQGSSPNPGYVNVNTNQSRHRRREHAYETIEIMDCEKDLEKTKECTYSGLPTNSQICTNKESEILNSNAAKNKFQSKVGKISAANEKLDQKRAINLIEKCDIPDSLRYKAISPALPCLPHSSSDLLRSWDAPSTSLQTFNLQTSSELILSKNNKQKSKKNSINGDQEKQDIKESFLERAQTETRTRRKPEMQTKCSKPPARRKTKRKVRIKKSYRDERRRRCIQSAYLRSTRNPACSGGEVVLGNLGQNRWPLPGVYFDSSSDSSGGVFKFKNSILKQHDPDGDAALREATLLEDIWCHLDEITKMNKKTKESHSSCRWSGSLTSSIESLKSTHSTSKKETAEISTEEQEHHHIMSPSSTSDRGYSTYKSLERSVFENKRMIQVNQQVQHEQTLQSSLVTVETNLMKDNKLGVELFNSATNSVTSSNYKNNISMEFPNLPLKSNLHCHLTKSPYNNKLYIPAIVLCVYDDENHPQQKVKKCSSDIQRVESNNELFVEKEISDAYLSVLDLYINNNNTIYEKLSNCSSIFDLKLQKTNLCPISDTNKTEVTYDICSRETQVEEVESFLHMSDHGSIKAPTDATLIDSDLRQLKSRAQGNETNKGCKDIYSGSCCCHLIPDNPSDKQDRFESTYKSVDNPLRSRIKHLNSNDGLSACKKHHQSEQLNESSKQVDTKSVTVEEKISCTPPKSHFFSEKTTKNYVVITPSLLLRHHGLFTSPLQDFSKKSFLPNGSIQTKDFQKKENHDKKVKVSHLDQASNNLPLSSNPNIELDINLSVFMEIRV